MQRRIVYCIGIILLAQVSFAQHIREISMGKAFRLASKALGEEREYWVSLPDSYNNDDFYSNKHYPLLVVLDAATHFQTVSAMVRAMSVNDEQIPEMIVVGIPNTNRQRDLTPTSSAAFIQFIEAELLPILDKTYRTLPYRLLAGHSMAGLFAIQLFLKQQPFNSYLLIDPTLRWSNNAIIEEYESMLAKHNTWKANIYLAQATNPFQDTTKTDLREEAFQQFVLLLKRNASDQLRYQHRYFANEDHFSIPTLSFYHGLLFLFQNYKFPLKTVANVRAEQVARHYETFAPIQPPGKLWNQIGLFLLQDKKIDDAIAILKLNETWYPASSVPFHSLGLAFRAKGDTITAIQYFKKALQRNKNNESAKKSIEELSKKLN